MSTPVDEFLEEFGPAEKTAGFHDQFGKAMVHGLGAGAATATIGVGAIAAKALLNAATKSRAFKQMLEYNPDLHDYHQADPRRFNQMFTSLHTMNPAFARDPIVAGTYMRQMVENPMNAGGILAQTLSHRDAFPSLLDRLADDASAVARSHFVQRQQQGGPGARSHSVQQQQQQQQQDGPVARSHFGWRPRSHFGRRQGGPAGGQQ